MRPISDFGLQRRRNLVASEVWKFLQPGQGIRGSLGEPPDSQSACARAQAARRGRRSGVEEEALQRANQRETLPVGSRMYGAALLLFHSQESEATSNT
jgi:hypothetical protein